MNLRNNQGAIGLYDSTNTGLKIASGSGVFAGSSTATSFIPTSPTIPTNGMYLSAANTLDFSTNSVNRLSINSVGNVGIGTSSPSERLHLANSTNGFVGLRLEGTGDYAGSDWTFYASSNSAPSADDFLGLYNNSATDGATVGYKFTLNKTGAVTINNLAGSGSRAVNADASGTLSAASDSRLKQEVLDYKIEGLAEILKMQPRAYKWLSDIKKRGQNAATEIGFFANEVASIIPSAAPMGNDGYYGFYDRAVIAALVNSVKELKVEIDILKNK